MYHVYIGRVWHRFIHHMHEIVVAITIEIGRVHTGELFLIIAAIFVALALQAFLTVEAD